MTELSCAELKYISMLIDYDCINNDRPLCETKTIGIGINGAQQLQEKLREASIKCYKKD